MPRTLKLVACAALWASSLGAQERGDSLYQAWCSRCHGSDARGTPSAMTRLSVPPADLASCAVSSPETEDQWVDIVARGGAAFGLSIDMPAYGDAASDAQMRAVVRYVRSLCRERAWPPGELNFPRAFLAEKAFPENEVIIAAHGRDQQLIFERRFGPRFQIEVEAKSDGGGAAGVKYNLWHSLERQALFSLGVEATPPLGDQELWEVEPFAAAGIQSAGFVAQGQVLVPWEETEGVSASLRLGIGRELGRFVPMVEAELSEEIVSLYPQVWIRLSRLGHVAGSIGADLRGGKLIAFLLWDFGDGPLLRGW